MSERRRHSQDRFDTLLSLEYSVDERDEVYAASLAAVPGEDAKVGHHYYPADDQVLTWLAGAGLEVLEEEHADYYWHLLTRTAAS